jgi:hypothetical protein
MVVAAGQQGRVQPRAAEKEFVCVCMHFRIQLTEVEAVNVFVRGVSMEGVSIAPDGATAYVCSPVTKLSRLSISKV